MLQSKENLIIPRGIRFISEWKDFSFKRFPTKCILNKQLPGCGFTEYCINGPENVILCSPRKMLLQNKKDQHGEEVYLVINEYEPETEIDKNLDKTKKGSLKSSITVRESDDKKQATYSRIKSEFQEYMGSRGVHKPLKILVTYDSYRIVQSILKDLELFQYFYTVVDEFQTILHDSRFKSDTELDFLHYLKLSHSALFVSATPTLDEYLDMLEEFAGLPYYKLDWSSEDPFRIKKPDLDVFTMKSVNTMIKGIISDYRNGNFEKTFVKSATGTIKEIISTEAVFYVNSVNHIVNIIKNNNLRPEEVNLLCSKTNGNLDKIKKKLGKSFEIGTVPLRGEINKMFTFCTRTVYLGADFYSKCARSFIFSDSNIESLAVDISEDLPQILGRQRDTDNPWKNQATFYYKTTHDYRKIKWEEFEKLMKEKQKVTENLLLSYQSTPTQDAKEDLAKTYEKIAKLENYKDNYVSVNTKNGYTPVFNNLVYVNELRAFKIQQMDYKDRFAVFTTIRETDNFQTSNFEDLISLAKEFEALTTFRGKLKLLCESKLSAEKINLFLNQLSDSNRIKSYYMVIGPKKLKALNYQRNLVDLEYSKLLSSDSKDLTEAIIMEFVCKQKLSLVDLKNKLKIIYQKLGYKATPKATDLEKYFELKASKIDQSQPDGTKKRVNGFELLSVKPEYQELYNKLHKDESNPNLSC